MGSEMCIRDRPWVTSLQLLTLPSLMELRALLRRPRGSAGSLELVSEALCSTKGPSSPGGLSLNWYEANQLNEFMGPEVAPALPDNSLSKSLGLCWVPVGPVESRACSPGAHRILPYQALPALSLWGHWMTTLCLGCSGGA